MTAIMPPATINETINIAMFCQKSKLPMKKARNSKIKASQQTPTITVPATLEPSEFMVLDIVINQLILLSHLACMSVHIENAGVNRQKC